MAFDFLGVRKFGIDRVLQTLEVATARVYNWDVTMKRKEKVESGEDAEGKRKGLPNG